ncbi:FbpB family small basic protein [Salinibacillus xinjiangensis]|uniref:FbpB family small basic protein n=1 Tax=Salinibacillus xinjiangensis TaxID=1229268 RepID=A0A6G1X431_9BACI|nr:FbpB family small basic protein [Salinibacillus xinjiangensis]MRG85588.1 FbpB family small basic protein [Salinibacillus xinjiangensis]
MRPRLPAFEELVNENKQKVMQDDKLMKKIDLKIEKKYGVKKNQDSKSKMN